MGREDRQHQGAQTSQNGMRNWVKISLVVMFTFITGLAIAQTAQEVRELLEWGDNEIALERADEGLEKTPEDAELRFYRALALARTGETEDALEAFEELAEQFPERPELHNNMAVLYALEGKYEEARGALEAALSTNEAYETAHNNLGDIYSAQAAEAYNRALARDEQRNTPKPELSLLSEWGAAAKQPAPVTKPAKAPAAKEPENKPLKVISTAETVKTAKAEAAPAPEKKPEVEKKPEPKADQAEAAAPQVVAKPKPTPKPEPVKATAEEPYQVVAEPAEKKPVKAEKPAKATEAATKTEAVPTTKVEEAAAPVIAPEQAQQAAQAVENWASAWRKQNADNYIAAYASFFRPENGMSHAAWAKQRRGRITSPKFIRVKLRNMRIRLKGKGRAIANFQQDYQSNTYQDSVKKVLYLENIKGDWKIVREVSE